MEGVLDHAKVIGYVIGVAALGGGLMVMSGRNVLRKWLFNGDDKKMNEIYEAVVRGKGCPVLNTGKTPLTAEQHEAICSTQRLLNQKDNKMVMNEVKHVRDAVDRIEKKINGN